VVDHKVSHDRQGSPPQPPPQGGSKPPAGGGPVGVAAPERSLQLPRDVIERLRTSVFGFDTLFVTSVENYAADGVLFKGNLRGDPATLYPRMASRLKVCRVSLPEGKFRVASAAVSPADRAIAVCRPVALRRALAPARDWQPWYLCTI